ncbi:DUF5412 family protein [Lysinibacillus sp. SGAir0095]|uniref:DUF5412 family protein n=1 Tax=Lysinibacillus sp. SGAir0095 TaxID=2070463 RepID=UPI0010CCC92C|nr:DUF5412 family protein [Lysinibacillus sp. SGAir0095]QCR32316.1 hypothetical protein C1N55_09070 [Lysinibacillus sp. SGAir0095]
MILHLNVLGFFLFFITGVLLLILIIRLIIFFFKKKRFPKKLLIASLIGSCMFFGIFVYLNYFFTFDQLKGESFTNPVSSPSKKYTVNAYLQNYGGAVGGVKIWVNITNHEENDQVKTVYYSESSRNFFMYWVDDETISISHESSNYIDSKNSIELNVGKDIYDETGIACTSLLMKDKYENCYYN